MNPNPLRQLERFGQAIWLDYIRRDLVVNGELRSLIEDDGLHGMTSNPAIFEKAISSSHEYDSDIQSMSFEGKTSKTILESITKHDVQMAAEEFRPLYERLDGKDGFVSLEVNPHLAHDTQSTLAEARRLWSALDRPNMFIKVPGTIEGLPAIRQLISEGINVNITLLFGLPRYRQVAQAYIDGIQDRLALGKDVRRVASVASFFVSRIDTMVDPMLEKIVAGGGEKAKTAGAVHGQVAVACAKTAYQIYKEIFEAESFKKLAEKGARPQRVLWASTGTKNPTFSDVKYVEALVGPETVNTVPLETLDAYRDHGNPQSTLENDVEAAADTMDKLGELGIDIDVIAQRLEDEGVDKFNKPFDQLLETLETIRARYSPVM
jgi:transaldolase